MGIYDRVMNTKKNHLRERIPNFIDSRGITPVEFEFDTAEELEQHPFVQRWLSKNPPSYLRKSGRLLMVVEDYGFTRWAIAWIEKPDLLDIPVMETKVVVQHLDGRIEIITAKSENKIVVVGGGEATLKNGEKCKCLSYKELLSALEEKGQSLFCNEFFSLHHANLM